MVTQVFKAPTIANSKPKESMWKLTNKCPTFIESRDRIVYRQDVLKMID